MNEKSFPAVNIEIIEREGKRWKEMLEQIIKKKISDDVYKVLIKKSKKATALHLIEEADRPAIQAIRISRKVFRLLNFLSTTDDGLPQKRKYEKDECGEEAFFVAHPNKVTHLTSKLFPTEYEGISDAEQEKFKYIDEHPFERHLCSSLHDFVEDYYKGELNTPHPETGYSAHEIIWDYILTDEIIAFTSEEQDRIWNRLVSLTKPPARYSKDPELSKEKQNEHYLLEYENYLNEIVKSNDPMAQYIKVCDIFQNAQSQKKANDKRAGKATLQAKFIKKTFPTFAAKFYHENPEFFEEMDNTDFRNEMAKQFPKEKLKNLWTESP